MVYFLGAIFFCSFYLLNLVLAVVALSYELEIKSVHKEVIPFFFCITVTIAFLISLLHVFQVSHPLECLVLDKVSLARLPSSNTDEGSGERGRAIINTE